MSTSRSDTAMEIAGIYFDGKSAAPIAVTLRADGRELVVKWPDHELRCPAGEARISERLGNTPRLIAFPDGGHCEVSDHARFNVLLTELGLKKGWLDVLQNSAGWAVFAVLLVAAVSAGAYRYLLPWAAESLSTQFPQEALQQMSDSTLKLLDDRFLQPSSLSAERQQELVSSFAAFDFGSGEPPHYRILFRRSKAMGANAFALPDGTLVLLDELVELAQNDREVSGVLAHELGHVQRRHQVRMLVQSSIVGLVMAWYVGDFSTLLAGASTVLLQTRYSRDMEREADEFAARMLQRNGMSACLLADMLGKLEFSHGSKKAKAPGERAGARDEDDGAMDYFASHPATGERIRMLCPKE